MNHSIGVTLKFADFASGATSHPVAPAGDLAGDDHHTALRSCADAARVAWTSADMNRTCELSFGLFPSDMAAGINLFDVLAHTWDIATATDVELDCDEVVWTVALDAAKSVIGTHRDPAHYAAVPFEAWVLFDGQPIIADSLPNFSGFGWRPPVVAAVPGAGWRVDTEDGEGPRPVEAWAIRSDGSAVALVVLDSVVQVVDPDLKSVTFEPPGWRKTHES